MKMGKKKNKNIWPREQTHTSTHQWDLCLETKLYGLCLHAYGVVNFNNWNISLDPKDDKTKAV